MSVEDKTKAEGAAVTDTAAAPATPASDEGRLAELMAAGPKGAPRPGPDPAGGPDLERAALRAAEAALAQGQQALAEARAQLQPARAPGGARAREVLLRGLLVLNLVAMVVVMLVPTPDRTESAPPAPAPAPVVHDPPAGARLDDPYARALAAADRGEFRAAIDMLEGYLQASPRLAPARRANVLFALEHWAIEVRDFKAADDYRRKADALRTSASLPDDLLQMAKEAERSGDAEAMRRAYARFLLQQRQIPGSLYKHIAEAYLKLGDSYRQEAQLAADAARRRELEEARAHLRDEARRNGAEGGK